MITIHYDFHDGTEVSFIEGRKLKDNFTTCCLDFFRLDNLTEGRTQLGIYNPDHISVDDVMVVCKNGNYISAIELLHNVHGYTMKHIRASHNIHKMLVAGSFNFKQGRVK